MVSSDSERGQSAETYLHDLHLVDTSEHRIQQGNLLDNHLLLLGTLNVDTVAHIIWMLDEEEDAGA